MYSGTFTIKAVDQFEDGTLSVGLSVTGDAAIVGDVQIHVIDPSLYPLFADHAGETIAVQFGAVG